MIFISTCAYQVSDWLYDEGSDADAATYEAKLSELKTLTGPLYRRVKENMERPEALAALHSMLNGSSNFLASARNMTTDSPDGLFTQVELDTLEKVIKETQVSEYLHLPTCRSRFFYQISPLSDKYTCFTFRKFQVQILASILLQANIGIVPQVKS